MTKQDIVKLILGDRFNSPPKLMSATSFCAANIAICKYWGKRDAELHLPENSSLSMTLWGKGSHTTITPSDQDMVSLNGVTLSAASSFASRIFNFMALFHQNAALKFQIAINTTVPIGAGLASSAAGFAALVKSLDRLYGWQLSNKALSILARLGSGSACRSIEEGFVIWHKGEAVDGMDSYAERLSMTWDALKLGIYFISDTHKRIPSRTAMAMTRQSSPLYKQWPQHAQRDREQLLCAIKEKNLARFGEALERNSTFMHRMLQASTPAITYDNARTVAAKNKIRACRERAACPIFFTQDAGPNLVVFFLAKDMTRVKAIFQEDIQVL